MQHEKEVNPGPWTYERQTRRLVHGRREIEHVGDGKLAMIRPTCMLISTIQRLGALSIAHGFACEDLRLNPDVQSHADVFCRVEAPDHSQSPEFRQKTLALRWEESSARLRRADCLKRKTMCPMTLLHLFLVFSA